MHNPPSNAEPKPFVVLVIYAAFLAAGLFHLGICLSGVLDAAHLEGGPEGIRRRFTAYALSASSLLVGFALLRFLKNSGNANSAGIRIARMIVQLACFEVIGVYGLMGPFLGLSRAESIGFILFSLAVMLVSSIWVLALYQSLARSAAEQNYRR